MFDSLRLKPGFDGLLTRFSRIRQQTVAYMSPEQAPGKELDARSDLFSLGVVLYEVATGKLPFQGDTPGAQSDSLLHQAPASFRRLNPEVPYAVERIISKTLEKDRQVRYQSAADLLADLNRLRRERDAGRAAEVPVFRSTEDHEAYDLYLKGRHFWYRRHEKGLQKGLQYFQQAIEMDPGYALPHVGITDTFVLLGAFGFMPPHQAFTRAQAAAKKALELVPEVAEVHASLGYNCTMYDWDWPAAESHFLKAIQRIQLYTAAAPAYNADIFEGFGLQSADCPWRNPP